MPAPAETSSGNHWSVTRQDRPRNSTRGAALRRALAAFDETVSHHVERRLTSGCRAFVRCLDMLAGVLMFGASLTLLGTIALGMDADDRAELADS